MRAVLQRVTHSSVTVDNEIVGSISNGLMVLLGVAKEDNDSDLEYLVDKIINLRVFEDENEKMNLSLKDVGGELLVVSQFTLYGDCRKGRRPGFDKAARPEIAQAMYEKFIDRCRSNGITVSTGKFQAMMMVEIMNDGPVTLILDSTRQF